MRVHELTLMIGTNQPAALARFYGDVLGLPRRTRSHDPVFEVAGSYIRILDHSGIHGPNGDPARMQLNLFVDDVRAEWRRLRAQGVAFVREPQAEPWGGLVATMTDPDGNYVQILEFMPR
ncbi:MAG: VOC family protein [Chloroflexi bacterium]|nr:VOC family protein [Chloroflexota bacterium]